MENQEKKKRNNHIQSNADYIANEKTKRSKGKFLITFIRIISIIVILICIGALIYRYFNLKSSKKLIDEISSDITIDHKNITVDQATAELIDTDILSLKRKNSDTVAFLKVGGTNISYPVVKASDNDFYLKHSFDKSYSQSGWIFMDYRNDLNLKDKNTIIYGHNMLNDTMFSELNKMLKNSFFDSEENRYINLSLENKSTLWKIFSVYISEPDTYYLSTNFSNNNTYLEFLNNLKNKSAFDLKEDVTNQNKILTLSTCTNLNTKRLVVHAKLVYEENK